MAVPLPTVTAVPSSSCGGLGPVSEPHATSSARAERTNGVSKRERLLTSEADAANNMRPSDDRVRWRPRGFARTLGGESTLTKSRTIPHLGDSIGAHMLTETVYRSVKHCATRDWIRSR